MDKLTLLSGYADVKYVDGTLGNDTTGNGSEALPYKTILKASQSVTMDDTMIYVAKEGLYEENTIFILLNRTYRVLFSTVTITDSDKKVYLRFTASDGTSGTRAYMTKENTFIGFIIQRASGNGYYFYSQTPEDLNISFQNCLFDKTPYNPSIYPIRTGYTVSQQTKQPIKLEFVNCTLLPENFSVVNNPATYYKGDFISCAIADSDLTPTAGNVLSGIFDNNFHLLSSSNLVGVYNGTYAWAFDEAKTLIHNDGKYKKYSNGLWIDISTTLPTEQEFKTHGMSLTTLRNINRELTTQTDNMINQGALGSANLFKVTVNLDKDFNILGLRLK